MPRTAFPNTSRYTSCVGIDDGPFSPKRLGNHRAPLLTVQLRGPHVVNVRTGWITVDGLDATDRAEHLLDGLSMSSSPILLAGVTFGGFNLIDPKVLQRRFRTPTIVIVGSRPDNRAVKRALVKHFLDWRERWRVIKSLGPLRQVRTVRGESPVFYEAFGCSSRDARKILSDWALVSRFPEPLRVAGMIGRGLFPPKPPA